MVSKQKIILSVVMIVLTTLFVGFSLFSVFAAQEQNVSTDVTVNYSAPSINAKVCATYQVDGGTENYFTPYNASGTKITGTNYLEFSKDATSKNAGSLRIASGGTMTSNVVIKYTFENTGSVNFKATLTTTSTLNNITLEYSTDGLTYSSSTSTALSVGSAKTKYFYAKATITESAFDATFTPVFNWKIEEV